MYALLFCNLYTLVEYHCIFSPIQYNLCTTSISCAYQSNRESYWFNGLVSVKLRVRVYNILCLIHHEPEFVGCNERRFCAAISRHQDYKSSTAGQNGA